MKRAGICLWMMIKRMGKHPVYWILLLLFPAALFVVPEFNRAVEEERIPVGYVMETPAGQSGEEKAAPKNAERTESDYSYSLPDLLERELTETAGGAAEGIGQPEENHVGIEAADETGMGELFQYIKYTDLNELKKDIETGEISCGVVFDAEFVKKLKEQDYQHCIALYLPEGMNVGGIVQENVFQKVYRAYSAVWYAELLEGEGYRIRPEEVLQKFSEYQREGKVFAVNYEVQRENNGELYYTPDSAEESSVLSLRGILAFLTLLSASLGALDGSRDRKRGAGKGIAGSGILSMAAVGAPILPGVLFLAGGMAFHNIKMTYVSEIGGRMEETVSGGFMQAGVLPELVGAFLYGLVLWLFAMAFGRLLPEKLLEGIMPCFLLIVLLCCPIFFDLGETIPLVGHLSKLFPITWYLEFHTF